MKMTEDDAKPTVLITGALAGIGRATAFAFAREGARVIVSGRHQAKGDELVAELRALGAEAEFVLADVRRDDDVRKLVDTAIERHGRLDVAVNNAGIEGTPAPITDQTVESYNATFDTNVLGTLLGMKHELRVMLPQRGGSIINVSSILGHEGRANASIYVASKHAVEGLTKSAALEVATSGIRVNAVAPGPIDTGMFHRFTGDAKSAAEFVEENVPLGRPGTADEVADTIVFLASKRASFMTGVILDVDGGKAAA